MSPAEERNAMPNHRGRRPLWPALVAAGGTVLLLVMAGCTRGGHSQTAEGPAPGNADSRLEPHTAAEAAVTPLSLTEAQAFIGDAACASCHPEICRQFAGTAHANTLRFVDERSFGRLFRTDQILRDSTIGYTYRPAVRNHRCVLLCDGTPGEIEAPADLAVGRGQNGVTFLGAVSTDSWATLRLSYYTVLKRWMFSPGQSPGDSWQPPVGQRLTPADVAACLSCHVTYLRQQDGRLDLRSSQLGVKCERCHGPGRRHMETARAAASGERMPITPMGSVPFAEPARAEALCGPCHSATEEPAHGGDASSIREIERFQTTALENSRCYREGDGLSCVTCHDPHTDVVRDESQTDPICIRCHVDSSAASTPARTGKPCPVNRSSGCVRCHMPATQLPDVPSQPFHNHWIKVWRQEKPAGSSPPGERDSGSPGRSPG